MTNVLRCWCNVAVMVLQQSRVMLDLNTASPEPYLLLTVPPPVLTNC
jgi:hypothetical protein